MMKQSFFHKYILVLSLNACLRNPSILVGPYVLPTSKVRLYMVCTSVRAVLKMRDKYLPVINLGIYIYIYIHTPIHRLSKKSKNPY